VFLKIDEWHHLPQVAGNEEAWHGGFHLGDSGRRGAQKVVCDYFGG